MSTATQDQLSVATKRARSEREPAQDELERARSEASEHPTVDSSEELIELVELAERESEALSRLRTEIRKVSVWTIFAALLGGLLLYPNRLSFSSELESVSDIAFFALPWIVVMLTFLRVLWGDLRLLRSRSRAHERALADILELVRESESRLPMSGMRRAQIRLRLSLLDIHRPTTP